MKNKATQIECLIDNHHGIYIPKIFAQEYGAKAKGIKSEDLEILEAGPEHEHYWDAWDDVLRDAILVSDTGTEYRLETGEGAPDLMLIPAHWEHDDILGWCVPESDTLRRYDLPSHWASAIFNGDYSGLSDAEEKEIDAWIADTVPLWTLADVSSESWFTHRPDNGGLGCDVSRHTFVRIP